MLSTVITMSATAAVKIEKTSYAGWPNCYRMTNGEVELIVTTDVGPRVIRYSFVGGQIVVKLAASGSGVEVTHRIRNTAAKPRELAPWALTMMAQGGTGIHGFPPRSKHMEVLTISNSLAMWGFSDLSDPRWKFTKKYMTLKQDPKATSPQKLGSFNPSTFGAYLLGSDLFIKRYTADPSKRYPDGGCSFETFTNPDFLELETVGPLRTVKQGEIAEHIEHWTLHKNVKIPALTDAELDRVLLPLLK